MRSGPLPAAASTALVLLLLLMCPLGRSLFTRSDLTDHLGSVVSEVYHMLATSEYLEVGQFKLDPNGKLDVINGKDTLCFRRKPGAEIPTPPDPTEIAQDPKEAEVLIAARHGKPCGTNLLRPERGQFMDRPHLAPKPVPWSAVAAAQAAPPALAPPSTTSPPASTSTAAAPAAAPTVAPMAAPAAAPAAALAAALAAAVPSMAPAAPSPSAAPATAAATTATMASGSTQMMAGNVAAGRPRVLTVAEVQSLAAAADALVKLTQLSMVDHDKVAVVAASILEKCGRHVDAVRGR